MPPSPLLIINEHSLKHIICDITYLRVSLISLASCGDCDDKTLQVNDDLLNWLPYSDETQISFSNQNNETLSFTISPDEDTRIEYDNQCTVTFIQPYIYMQNVLWI